MERLSDKARMYARSYGQPPYGREVEGTAELLLQMAEKLEKYEVLEEQGKLLKLPCAVGDTVYVIPSSENFGINIVNGHEENNRVYEQIVDHVDMRRSGYLLITCDGMSCVIEKFYKKTWFTDKKEAKVKLKELEKYWKKYLTKNEH